MLAAPLVDLLESGESASVQHEPPGRQCDDRLHGARKSPAAPRDLPHHFRCEPLLRSIGLRPRGSPSKVHAQASDLVAHDDLVDLEAKTNELLDHDVQRLAKELASRGLCPHDDGHHDAEVVDVLEVEELAQLEDGRRSTFDQHRRVLEERGPIRPSGVLQDDLQPSLGPSRATSSSPSAGLGALAASSDLRLPLGEGG